MNYNIVMKRVCVRMTFIILQIVGIYLEFFPFCRSKLCFVCIVTFEHNPSDYIHKNVCKHSETIPTL